MIKDKFYNRKEEIQALNKWWQEKKSQLVIVYGKRRVGKTALCLEFTKNKPYIYYLSEKLSPNIQLKKISEEIGKFFEDSIVSENGFSDWMQLFRYLANKNEKFVFVIDEFPYLVESDSSIPSTFQKGWDLYLSKSKVNLILCGSSIGMMEEHTLNYRAPLFGRRSGQILVKPFSYFNFTEVFPKLSSEEKLLIYSIVDGTITYLKYFIGKNDIWKVVRENILSKEQFLYSEVEFLLREEFREPRNYFSILLSLSIGNNKLSELINDTGFDKSYLSSYLATLTQLLIIKKKVPVTEKNIDKSKKGRYKICDNFFEFWFNFVFRNRQLIEEGKNNEVVKIIRKNIQGLITKNYEEICREITKSLPQNFLEVGRWWDNNEEIDVVGINKTDNSILFGEAKWSDKLVGINIYKDLIRKSKLVDWGKGSRKEYFALFSKSGFTKDMLELAKKENVFLFKKDKLCKQEGGKGDGSLLT